MYEAPVLLKLGTFQQLAERTSFGRRGDGRRWHYCPGKL